MATAEARPVPLDQVNSPVLELTGLTVAFKSGATPLKSISCTLYANEILGVVGETGAGKSLLARAIIDLLPQGGRISAGDVRFLGRSLRDMTDEERRRLRGGRVALIGTNAKALLDPVTPVGKQIARVLRAHRPVGRAEAYKAAIELLGEVGITNPAARAKSYPHELSGGMAQRIVIAMALVAEPKLLLADDATLGLDATVQAQVLENLVRRSRERGLSVILITHDLGIVRQYCDRVAVIRDGELIEIEEVGEFLDHPKRFYSRELIAAARARPPLRRAAVRQETRALVEVRDLTMHFMIADSLEPIRAVDGVSFTINQRETLALVGESGSGKTTVGQCILRLLSATDGRIFFDGKDVSDLTERNFRPLRRRIQMVFQEPYVALNPLWRVADLLAEPFRLLAPMSRAERSRRVSELLENVHLNASYASRYPHELTAGEQKRIGIARALATSPDFIVFDEPTTALDIRVRAQIIDLIRDLQTRIGLSALFITHDLNSVRSLAHRVAVMHLGKIVESGQTEDIFRAPRQEYTRKLLAAELSIERVAASPVAALQ